MSSSQSSSIVEELFVAAKRRVETTTGSRDEGTDEVEEGKKRDVDEDKECEVDEDNECDADMAGGDGSKCDDDKDNRCDDADAEDSTGDRCRGHCTTGANRPSSSSFESRVITTSSSFT